MKTKNLIAVIAAAFLSSCTPQKEVAGDVSFSREDFQTTKELSNPQEIAIDSLLNPAGFRVMNDSVLVVVNQTNCEFLLDLYSLNTLQPLAQLITKGNGPGEMFSCALGLHSNASDNFYLQDSNSKTCYIVDLKTLLNSRRFVPDEQVKYYFSAVDFVVQPYKTATQSGVTQIAYQFCVPMVVTDVGGLSEIVPDGRVGYVCEPTVQGVADAIARMYDGDTIERFRLNCTEERKRFSWEEMCTRIAELYEMVR